MLLPPVGEGGDPLFLDKFEFPTTQGCFVWSLVVSGEENERWKVYSTNDYDHGTDRQWTNFNGKLISDIGSDELKSN